MFSFKNQMLGRLSPNRALTRGLNLLVAAGLVGLFAGCASSPMPPDLPPTSPPVASAPPAKTIDANKPPQLKFIGEARLPNRMRFQNTIVGGLSGLDYDAQRDVWYMISDDTGTFSSPRFYTAKLDFSGGKLNKVDIVGVTFLRRPDGSIYPSPPGNESPDAESIRYDSVTDRLFYTSEGTRKPPRFSQSFVQRLQLDGKFDDALNLPEMFTISSANRGPRDNLSFEGMTITSDGRRIWLAMEDAMVQDGPVSSLRQGGLARISMIDRTARSVTAQFAYRLEPVAKPPVPANDYADNGIAEILALDVRDNVDRLLVLERSYSVGVGNTIRVFMVKPNGATNTLNIPSLSNVAVNTLKKTLVLNFDSLGLPKIDNLEGMAWGPRLPNGNRTLVFVSDDNFAQHQITQFLAFEVIE